VDELFENTPRPDIADFTDFRQFLREFVVFLKKSNPHFSYRYFARRAEFASPNFLKLVAEGKRNLSMESTERFSAALGFTAAEKSIFEAMVAYGQATTDEESNRHYQRMRKLQATTHPSKLLEQAQYDVYSQWIALPIRELALLPGFREDATWIASQLWPEPNQQQVRRALILLEHVGLMARDAEGVLRPTCNNIETPSTVICLAVRNYHRAMLRLSEAALDRLAVHERNVSSVTISLSPQQYDRACELVNQLRSTLLDLADLESGNTTKRVYHLGFQVVPLSREVGK
jgi:uncharacterized protein (TIGR02147 family)